MGLIRNPRYLYRIPNYYNHSKFKIKKNEVRTILDELSKMIKKSKLTKEELKEFLIKMNNIDPKLEHSLAARTLTNPMRRKIMQFINCEVKSVEDIKKDCNLDINQLTFHLNMLKQTNYVIDSVEGWKLTPRGIGFLENAKLSE